MGEPVIDQALAVADLCNRANAKGFELGYLDDEPPHRWWASADYQGAKLIVEGHHTPGAAADALARRLLDGALCTHCGRRTLTGRLASRAAPPATRCVWQREGDRWVRGCTAYVPEGRRIAPHDVAPTQRGVLPDH